jgi:hypothetical protein
MGLGLSLALSGCGLTISRSGDYYLRESGDYPLEVRIEPGGQSVHIREVTALVGRAQDARQPLPMVRSMSDTNLWTARYSTTEVKGLYVSYRVRYSTPALGFLWPQDSITTIPKSGAVRGEYLLPILARDADADGDNLQDRFDTCPFVDLQYCSNTRKIDMSQTGPPTSGDDVSQLPLKTEMRSNLGNHMVTVNGIDFFSFDQLVDAKAGLNHPTLLSGAGLQDVVLHVQKCLRVYDDEPGGYSSVPSQPRRFLQVYAEAEGFPCTWAITSDGVTLLQGKEVLITVSTPTAGARIGIATVQGRATLMPPADDAPASVMELYRALTAGSATGYVYFHQFNLQALAVTVGRSEDTAGHFAGPGFLFLPPVP